MKDAEHYARPLLPLADSSASLSLEAIPARGRQGNLSPERRKIRAEQNAEAKRRQRSRDAGLGDRLVTIKLTANEAQLVGALLDRMCPPSDRAGGKAIRAGKVRRALIVGMVMLANAGCPKGKKVKGSTAAAGITGLIADMSANGGECPAT